MRTLQDRSAPIGTLLRTCQASLDPSEPFRTLLDSAERFRAFITMDRFESSGPFWSLVDPAGPFLALWTRQDPSELFRTIQDYTA